MIIIIYFCHNYHYYYEQLEQVKQFKYLGRSMPGSGRSTNEVKIRAAAMAMSSLAKMDKKGERPNYSRTPLFRSPKGNGKKFEIAGFRNNRGSVKFITMNHFLIKYNTV